MNDERLIDEYIGEKSELIKNEKVNWAAAFLGQSIGPVWFFYRKSYLIGFAFIILTTIVGRIALALNIEDSYFIMFFIYLFLSDKIYLWDVKRKVEKIKQENSNMEEEQLANLIRTKGGTSSVAAVLYTIALIAIITTIGFLIISLFKGLSM